LKQSPANRYCASVPADGILMGFYFLTSSLSLYLASYPGRTSNECHTCSNTCSLGVILMDYTFFKIFSDIVLGYIISTSVFLLLTVLFSRLKLIKTQYLNNANWLILFLSLAFYIIYCTIVAYNQKSLSQVPINKSYLINSIAFLTVTVFLIPLLFTFKKLRLNVFITLLVMLSLWIFTNYEKAVIIITSFYRDYLPSSWSVEYPAVSYISIGITTVLYFFMVIVSLRLRKTNA